jgi:cytoskeletal protein CcmA (bactofilin family)
MARAATTVHTPGTMATLGKTTVVRGRISGDGDLRIEGNVQGDVAVRGELVIAGGAELSADVQASAVTIEGVLEGDIRAEQAVTIRSTARVKGAIVGSRITIDEGASVSGRIDADFDLPPELLGKPSSRS